MKQTWQNVKSVKSEGWVSLDVGVPYIIILCFCTFDIFHNKKKILKIENILSNI